MSLVEDRKATEPAGPARRFGPPTMRTLFTAVFVLFGWCAGLRTLDDNSFLIHLRTGHWILRHGIPYQDPFSYTAPHAAWVAQSWLAEVGYALLDLAGGPALIRLFCAAVGAAIAFLTYRMARSLAGDHLIAAFLTVPALVASAVIWSERPMLLGVLAFVALVAIVELPVSRPVLLIPPLIWLWANVHGTFILGLGYLVLHLVGRRLDGARLNEGRERRLLQATGLATLVCFANPYGFDLVAFPFRLMMRNDILSAVSEWVSPNFRTFQGALYALWVVTVVAVFALAKSRPSRRDVLVVGGFLVLGFYAQRNIALAPLVTLPVIARLVAMAKPRAVTGGRLNWAVLMVLGISAVMFTGNVLARPAYGTEPRYPVNALRWADRHQLLGRHLLTTDAWAAYVIRDYWPRQRVFVDDRYDMYPKQVMYDYFHLMAADPSWHAITDRYGVDVVVWQPNGVLTQVLAADPQWHRVYADRTAVVLTRETGS